MTYLYSLFEFEDKSPAKEKLKAGMNRILNEPLLIPTHASFEDGRKPRWDPEILEVIPEYDVLIQIWKKGSLDGIDYEGMVAFQDGDFQMSELSFPEINARQERDIYEATERIASESELILGFLLPYRSSDSELQIEVGKGRSFHVRKVRDFGWFGTYPRTWFGRRSWPTIEKVASKFPGAKIKELASGTIQYDIVERPWELTDHEYIDIRNAFQRKLEEAGIGADYSDTLYPRMARLWEEPTDWITH